MPLHHNLRGTARHLVKRNLLQTRDARGLDYAKISKKVVRPSGLMQVDARMNEMSSHVRVAAGIAVVNHSNDRRDPAMTTLVWDYLLEYEIERDDILAAVDMVFRSGRLVFGESTKSFEREFAAYHGIDHSVGVDNGTNAIKLGLQALGIGPGDEVITVSNTAAPTVVAISALGAVPVFVDIRHDDYLMETSQLANAVTARTRCIVPVHLYGQCVEMKPVQQLAAKHGISILEDCAQSHGARQYEHVAGTFGDAGAFSFYPTKVLGAYGDGGAVITGDKDIDEHLRRLRYYGMKDRYYVVETPGHNSRLDEVHAEILRRKLGRLDQYIAARRAVAARYAEGLGDTDLGLPALAAGNDHVYYLYVVRHPRRDEILEQLLKYDIELNVSYRWPVHTMSGFSELGYSGGSLPNTEEAAREIFSLPMYPSLPLDVQERVIDALREILARF